MTHLDDALLSAHLDGEAVGGDDAGHLEACGVCAARLARLRAAAAFVATPVPQPPDEAREAAVAAALAAGGLAPQAAGDEPAPLPAPSNVVPLRGRWARAASPWLAAAAVIGALVLGVGLLANGGDDRGDDVASPAALDEPAGARAQLEAAEGAGLAVVDGGDLGEFADGDALRIVVEQRLAHREEAASAAADAPPPGSDGAGGDVGVAMGEAARCEDSLRAADTRLGSLVYVATLRWEGTPAVLLAFTLPEGRLTTAVYVVAPEAGCELLLQQSF